MPLPDRAIHELLRKFGPHILKLLASIEFFSIDGTYDAAEVEQQIRSAPEWKRYQVASEEKNSRIWEIVGAAYILDAIVGGSAEVAKKYRLPVIPKPTAQDYMNRYIKSHGGEFITNMSRTDQRKLVNFIWYDAGRNERPFAKIIDQQPHLRYVLDQGNHRTETIIRTEKFRATNYGSWRFAGDNGATKKRRWEVGDKRTRASHRAMIGQVVAIDKPYSNGEMFPGEKDINCRGHDEYIF
ncbi:phage head morphogenesis protein [Candidatus Pacearchaeota archaeon]|jgi:hypothetical protein|nr:phage head morphogenesis protein [Candidatus Pacearchaeota archaeon]